MKRAVTALVLEPKGRRVLVVARRGNDLDLGLPGGKIDPGETPTQAIVREVREETGLEIFEPSEEDIVHSAIDSENYHTTCYFVRLHPSSVGRGIRPIDGEGLARWAHPEEVLAKNCRFAGFNGAVLQKAGLT